MTLGERIAQKRKELGLSQEALGEKLCVSRQSIYKWESDTALPEIEKLVALSALFEVSVGWLLGVEAESEGPKEEADDGQLNETQMKMVEEIVNRYLAAQPQPKKPRKGLRVLAAVVILAIGIHFFNRLDGLDNQYNNLQNGLNNLNWNVNNQIGGIANRVEEILKAQNDLTADYGTELLRVDPTANTATFRLRAVPKTFVDGMSAVFLVSSGTGPVEVAAQLSEGGVFSAEADVALTDEISLSVVFINPDGTRQTQLLDTHTGLLADSIPWVDVSSNLHWEAAPDGVVNVGKDMHGNLRYADVSPGEGKAMGAGVIEVAHVEVGVFVNKAIVGWAEECEQPGSYIGDWGERVFFRLPDVTVTLKEGDQLWVAALVTDSYGRQFMAYDIPYVVQYDEKGNGELEWASDFDHSRDIADWALTSYEVEEIFHTTTPIGKP